MDYATGKRNRATGTLPVKTLLALAILVILFSVVSYYNLDKPLTHWIQYNSAHDIGKWVHDFQKSLMQ
jgi:hypothetical protein